MSGKHGVRCPGCGEPFVVDLIATLVSPASDAHTIGGTRAKQQTIPGTDTKLSRVADAVLVQKTKLNNVKEDYELAVGKLLGEIKAAGKTSLIHGGYRFTINHKDAADSLSVKELA